MTLTDFLLARIAEDERAATMVRASYPNLVRGEWCRALVEVEVKRRMLARHAEVKIQGYEDRPGCCDHCDGAPDWPCADVSDLAAIYADHPDCRAEWKP